jgi:hypothetical protein
VRSSAYGSRFRVQGLESGNVDPMRATPVATLHQSSETGNSNTPLGLPPGSTHTIVSIEYKVMTTTTKMTKLLSMSRLLLWPQRAVLSVFTGPTYGPQMALSIR